MASPTSRRGNNCEKKKEKKEKNENNENKENKENKEDKKEKKEKQEKDIKEKISIVEKENEKNPENVKNNGKILLKSTSRPNLALTLKNINEIIKEEHPQKEEEEEEEKNNSKNRKILIDIINIKKKLSNYNSPDKLESSTNKNNSNSKPKPKKKVKKEYKLQYCVYPGNNMKLIETAMEHRSEDWEKVPTTYSEFCDLVWAPLTCNINFQTAVLKHQYVNHLEFNIEISNKMRLYANLFRHCEEIKTDIFSIVPFTISLQISHRSFYEQLNN